MTNFIQTAIVNEFNRLRSELALHRGVLRNMRRSFWEPDHYCQTKRWKAIEEEKVVIRTCELALDQLLVEYKDIVGNPPNKGRLCWDSFTGGQPIDIHYCTLPEGHSGHHSDSQGAWHATPKHRTVQPPKPIIRLIMQEESKHEALVLIDGQQQGPRIVKKYGGKLGCLRVYSCQGCQWLKLESASPLCAHPEMLRKYKVPQSVANHKPPFIVGSVSCAVGKTLQTLTQPIFFK